MPLLSYRKSGGNYILAIVRDVVTTVKFTDYGGYSGWEVWVRNFNLNLKFSIIRFSIIRLCHLVLLGQLSNVNSNCRRVLF